MDETLKYRFSAISFLTAEWKKSKHKFERRRSKKVFIKMSEEELIDYVEEEEVVATSEDLKKDTKK